MFRSRDGESQRQHGEAAQRDGNEPVMPVGLCCEEAERWLTRIYASSPHPVDVTELPAQLSRHVEACADCRREVEGRAWLPVAPGEGAQMTSTVDPLFVQSVMVHVRAEPAPVRTGERWRLGWRIEAWRWVAMLLLAVGLALLLREVATGPAGSFVGSGGGLVGSGGGRGTAVDELVRGPGELASDSVASLPGAEIPDASGMSMPAGLALPDLVAVGPGVHEFIDPRPANCQRILPVRRQQPPALPEEVL